MSQGDTASWNRSSCVIPQYPVDQEVQHGLCRVGFSTREDCKVHIALLLTWQAMFGFISLSPTRRKKQFFCVFLQQPSGTRAQTC